MILLTNEGLVIVGNDIVVVLGVGRQGGLLDCTADNNGVESDENSIFIYLSELK